MSFNPTYTLENIYVPGVIDANNLIVRVSTTVFTTGTTNITSISGAYANITRVDAATFTGANATFRNLSATNNTLTNVTVASLTGATASISTLNVTGNASGANSYWQNQAINGGLAIGGALTVGYNGAQIIGANGTTSLNVSAGDVIFGSNLPSNLSVSGNLQVTGTATVGSVITPSVITPSANITTATISNANVTTAAVTNAIVANLTGTNIWADNIVANTGVFNSVTYVNENIINSTTKYETIQILTGTQAYFTGTLGVLGETTLTDLTISGMLSTGTIVVRGSTNTRGLTSAYVNCTGALTTVSLTGGSGSINNLSVNHLLADIGSNCTIADAGASNTLSWTCTGTDAAGIFTFTLNTGTATLSGNLVTVTFAQPFTVSPAILLTPANVFAADFIYNSGIGATSTTNNFTVFSGSHPINATTGWSDDLQFHYMAIGKQN
jgi:hypothetical protein